MTLKLRGIKRLASSYGASNVRVFGSCARGDRSPSSDIDFLVNLEPDRTLMDLGGLLMELQELLQMRAQTENQGSGGSGRGAAMRDLSHRGAAPWTAAGPRPAFARLLKFQRAHADAGRGPAAAQGAAPR